MQGPDGQPRFVEVVIQLLSPFEGIIKADFSKTVDLEVSKLRVLRAS
jgi:hypothetical protein